MADAAERSQIQSLARGLAILSAVAATSDGLSPRELSEALVLKRATTYNLVNTLVDEGFLLRDVAGRYKLGFAASLLGQAFARQVTPIEVVLPLVRQLADTTGETAYAATLQDGEVVILCGVPGRHSVNVSNTALGVATDAHARASGKAILAFADAETRQSYLDRHPLRACTPRTITDRAELEAHLERVALEGYASEAEEFVAGVGCLAAIVPGAPILLALSLSAPLARFEERFDAYRAGLLAVAGLAPAPQAVLGSAVPS